MAAASVVESIRDGMRGPYTARLRVRKRTVQRDFIAAVPGAYAQRLPPPAVTAGWIYPREAIRVAGEVRIDLSSSRLDRISSARAVPEVL
jgi:hypothetical protein